MSIARALDQMERAMGANATPESRAAVNAETLAARNERDAELNARVANRGTMPRAQIRRMSDAEFLSRMQSGQYGRLG